MTVDGLIDMLENLPAEALNARVCFHVWNCDENGDDYMDERDVITLRYDERDRIVVLIDD